MEAASQPLDFPVDPERPRYHVMGKRGWINDPNGPIYFNGKYHLFFQHLPTGCEWDWGLVWGHAVSVDLVHWEHLPPALRPSPGRLDADGCFSGCCTVDSDGVPTILYTGVRLRSNQECGPLPPAECDLQLPFIEAQLIARADPRDAKLVTWVKQDAPFLALPPPNLPLTGWRDPFVIQKGDGRAKDWIILMGAGLKNEGGTTLIYRAKTLDSTWEYAGTLCLGDPSIGAMWECPLLWSIDPAPDPQALTAGAAAAPDSTGSPRRDGSGGASVSSRLQTVAWGGAGPRAAASAEAATAGAWIFARPAAELQRAVAAARATGAAGADARAAAAARMRQDVASTSGDGGGGGGGGASTAGADSHRDDDAAFSHFYCISPDAPSNPVLYWMGTYDPASIKFRLSDAVGPFRLDLGDTVYAPNIFEDQAGRCVLWGWVQERRGVGNYEFSGCMSTPRVLLRDGRRLVQQPLPELAKLRRGARIEWPPTALPANARVPLEGVAGRALDVELVLARGSAYVSGVMLQSWSEAQGAAAILFDWETSMLEVVFEGLDPDTKMFSISAPTSRRIGGRVDAGPGAASGHLALRVMLDHSLLEIFTGGGQALTTRIYRGTPPALEDPGIDFLSLGGEGEVVAMSAWELDTIWSQPEVVQPAKARTAAFTNIVNKFEDLLVEDDISSPKSPSDGLGAVAAGGSVLAARPGRPAEAITA